MGSRRRPQAERHDIDALFGRAEQLDEIPPRGLRVRDHAIRACNGERHEHAHAKRTHARMRFGEPPVDEVMHRDDAPERSPPGCRGRERVDEVDTGAPRESRQQQLLAADPLEPVRNAHRHLDLRDQLTPRPRTRVSVDERGEAHPGRCRAEQRRDRLARRRLHPAGLPGNEEDQVKADVYRGGVHGW